MALSTTLLKNEISGASSPGTGTFATTSFTPTANSKLTVVMFAQVQGGTVDPSAAFTASGGSLTYNPADLVGDTNSWSAGMRVWTADVGASPSSMTITCGTGGTYNTAFIQIVVFQTTGQQSTIGAVGHLFTNAASGAFNITLGAAPNTNSHVIGVAAVFNNNDGGGGHNIANGGAGYTDLITQPNFDTNWSVSNSGEYRTGSTSTTFGWSNVGTSSDKAYGVAVEIIQAAGASNSDDDQII